MLIGWYWPWLWYGAAMMNVLAPEEAEVARLPPPKPRPPERHALGVAIVILSDPATQQHEQVEKTCRNCGVTRVTVIGGAIPRLWRLPKGGIVFAEPVCEAVSA